MRRTVIGIMIVVLVVLALAGLGAVYAGRLKSIRTLRRVTDYADYNLYRMDIRYDYSIDHIISFGITDNQSVDDAILQEALPMLPIQVKAPQFGCSAFTTQTQDGHILMGRNYDFKDDSSAMLVYCTPKNGYKSVALAALDNISANRADESIAKKLACLIAPFICLDGMNEKGVSIAVLTLDSEPVNQDTGRQKIFTTLAIRLVLDRAATTQEAVDLLGQYDMLATSGRDYHFYITDAAGDGRVVEYDPDDAARPMVVTEMNAITNFFGMYSDRVEPDRKNGVYGHGKERYNAIIEALDADAGHVTETTAWTALKAAAQEPNPEDVTSNTQWSLIYDNTALTAQIVIRRDWGTVTGYDLRTNTIQ